VKLAPARVEAFLRQPDAAVRAVLLCGPDAGLVRERADLLARSVCYDLADPFRVADLTAATLTSDPARLADEAGQLSLVGGRRVVRVRAASDSLARLFGSFLDTAPGEALVVVEAGELSTSSSLRRLFDASPHATAITCYPDSSRDRGAVIRDTLTAHRVAASRDAVQYLIEHLGGDRLMTRSELEKLVLYAGDGGRIDLDDARLAVGDSAAVDLDDALMAAAEGDAPRLDRVLSRVFQEGESAVAVIRRALRHLQRLQLLTARRAGGSNVDEIIRATRPPIFFKHQDGFRRQLTLWTEAALRRELDRLAEAELNMKTTGLPAETICREALLRLSQAARGGSPREAR
jgi:DNA polymerase-3 subunit delta